MRILAVLLLCSLALPVRAADRAGEFSHYVLSLSWNATWCALEGDARAAEQCDPRHDWGWMLHGLWPQGDRDWPEYCRTSERDPARRVTEAMSDIMASQGLAWHQWKKHGRCSGLSAEDYFALSREAFQMINRPALLRKIKEPLRVSPAIIEEAFLEANPSLRPNQVAVTCRDGMIQEVRVCLSKALVPLACTLAVERGCRSPAVTFPPMR